MSSISSLLPHLQQRYESQRIVFWHDADGEYASELDELGLEDVTILRAQNNEYAVKNRVLHDQPTAKFLIYRGNPVPPDTVNWLLDLELAYGVFTADRTALITQDLGLSGNRTSDVIREHARFFRSTKRHQSLKELVTSDDDPDTLRAKMCAVIFSQRKHSLLELTRTLLIENAQGNSRKYEALVEHGLDSFHWAGAAKIYGYRATEPSVDDFTLWIFRQAINGFTSEIPGALRNIQLDFDSLRNNRHSASSLAELASRAAENLSYAASIEDAELADLNGNDLFEEVERKVIHLLTHGIVERTISPRQVAETIRSRQRSIWFENYKELYAALGAASELLNELSNVGFEVTSFDDGLNKYRQHWFRIDQLYRQFHLALRTTKYAGPLEELRIEVDKHYTNQHLYELGNSWQKQVDKVQEWRSMTLRPQASFYANYVEPIIRKGTRKVAVIISDALRFEVADELRSRIRQEDRFEAELDALLGVLPSYTQLGMAALLPHKTLEHSLNGDPVLVDGQRSDGTASRGKILATVNGLAIPAESVNAMRIAELRELYVAHQMLYIYHDRIDTAGDNTSSEHEVFEAAEKALDDLVALIKRLTNANATNILITADHGFLYQNNPLSDAFYLSTRPQGDELLVTNRRYVLGRGLKEDPAFRKFKSSQLGLASDLEVQIPKSIHRLRLPGAGSRFVHGGATLQEVVVPVLTINKKRKSDTRSVNVEILPETDKITTGQLVVKLFQTEPVSEKIQPRTLRGGIYIGDDLISNQPELIFDQPSEDKRDRYQNVQMLLSQEANEFNNLAVEFRLDEQIPNTTQWRVYQRTQYLLKRSFMSDFDF